MGVLFHISTVLDDAGTTEGSSMGGNSSPRRKHQPTSYTQGIIIYDEWCSRQGLWLPRVHDKYLYDPFTLSNFWSEKLSYLFLASLILMLLFRLINFPAIFKVRKNLLKFKWVLYPFKWENISIFVSEITLKSPL